MIKNIISKKATYSAFFNTESTEGFDLWMCHIWRYGTSELSSLLPLLISRDMEQQEKELFHFTVIKF
jgi:hypothetical protein